MRVALGAIAGLISTGLVFLFQSFTTPVGNPQAALIATIGRLETLLNGISIALVVYLVSYYILKAKYLSQVEKQSKIMSTGIFIYFLTWIVTWGITLSFAVGPV